MSAVIFMLPPYHERTLKEQRQRRLERLASRYTMPDTETHDGDRIAGEFAEKYQVRPLSYAEKNKDGNGDSRIK
jgi:hypothetical protein